MEASYIILRDGREPNASRTYLDSVDDDGIEVWIADKRKAWRMSERQAMRRLSFVRDRNPESGVIPSH